MDVSRDAEMRLEDSTGSDALSSHVVVSSVSLPDEGVQLADDVAFEAPLDLPIQDTPTAVEMPPVQLLPPRKPSSRTVASGSPS